MKDKNNKKIKTFVIDSAIEEEQVPKLPLEKTNKKIERTGFIRARVSQERIITIITFISFLIIVSLFYINAISVISKLYKVQGRIPQLSLKIIRKIAREGEYMLAVKLPENEERFADSKIYAIACYDEFGNEIVKTKRNCPVIVKYYKSRIDKKNIGHEDVSSMLSAIYFKFEYNSNLDGFSKKDKSLYATKLITEIIN